MASAQYSPYSTVSNSYNQFMGPPASGTTSRGPYTSPINSLRSGGDITNINTMGDMSPQERIANRSQKEYEKWKASQMTMMRKQGEYAADKGAALAGLNGVNYNNYQRATGGGNSPTLSAYDAFMSNQGAAGLFGGSVSTPGQRFNDWNTAITDQASQYQQAMTPVNLKYGTKPVNTSIYSLNPW